MAFLVLKNGFIRERAVSMRELHPGAADPSFRIHFARLLPHDLNVISTSPSYYYLTNKLILTLEYEEGETERSVFKTDIGTSPSLEDGRVSDVGFQLWFKGEMREGGTTEWDRYRIHGFRAAPGSDSRLPKYTSVSRDKIEIEFPRFQVEEILRNAHFTEREFGILILPIKFLNPSGEEFTLVYGIKVTTNEVFSLVPPLIEASAPSFDTDYSTPGYTFDSLFIPELHCNFVYNFYEPEEDNYDIISERSYSGVKVQDIPKYIELNWTPAPVYHEPLFVVTDIGASAPTPGGSESGMIAVDGHVYVPEEGISVESAAGTDPLISEAFRNTLAGSGFLLGGREEDEGFEGTGTGSSPFAPTDITLDLPVSLDEIRADVDRRITETPTPEATLEWSKSEYVGYTIQKERYDEYSDTYEPLDLFLVKGRLRNRLIDWKVAYGETYRYRIRSVFKFVNKNRLPMYRDSDEVIDNASEFSILDTSISRGGVENYYYDGRSSEDCLAEVIDLKRPDPPFNVQIFPCSLKREIFITWNQKNQNHDVVGFNVYKKQLNDRLFTKLNTEILDIRENFWIDKSVEEDVSYIYAIESEDVHGNFSMLSAQYSAMTTTQNIDILHKKCEAPVEFFEWEGQDLNFESLDEIEERKDNLFFTKNKLLVRVNPLFENPEESGPFLLKITSLDSGEVKEIMINFDIKTIYYYDPLIVRDIGRDLEGLPLSIDELDAPRNRGIPTPEFRF